MGANSQMYTTNFIIRKVPNIDLDIDETSFNLICQCFTYDKNKLIKTQNKQDLSKYLSPQL